MFPYLLEFSMVCCDPPSQSLWHSQWSRNRCFHGTLLLFRRCSGCWQFDFWFLFFSKTSWNIWKLIVHILLKPGFENFKHYFTSMWDECNCAVVWTLFGIAFLWIGMKTDLSSVVATAESSKFAGILSATLSQHHLSGFEIAQLEFHHLH